MSGGEYIDQAAQVIFDSTLASSKGAHRVARALAKAGLLVTPEQQAVLEAAEEWADATVYVTTPAALQLMHVVEALRVAGRIPPSCSATGDDEVAGAVNGERCQVCGQPYDDVYWLPDEWWHRITPKPDKPGAGLLCPQCALDRLRSPEFTGSAGGKD
jgi:hypothetical protein